jgi:SAM-dependent methyltransferase
VSDAQSKKPFQPHQPIIPGGTPEPRDFQVHMQSVWDKHHEVLRQTEHPTKPHEFAVSVQPYVSPGQGIHATVLELGSGMGSDATYFASNGAKVTSVDISPLSVAHNTQRNKLPNLEFKLLDFSQPLPFAAETYDVVYAHLTLRYFDIATTESIFAEVARVLKPNGYFFFACESSDDPEYGQGVEIEPGVFRHKDCHIRHFFSVPYTQELTNKRFQIMKIEEGQGTYRGEPSVFVYCWAQKRTF